MGLCWPEVLRPSGKMSLFIAVLVAVPLVEVAAVVAAVGIGECCGLVRLWGAAGMGEVSVDGAMTFL